MRDYGGVHKDSKLEDLKYHCRIKEIADRDRAKQRDVTIDQSVPVYGTGEHVNRLQLLWNRQSLRRCVPPSGV